MDDWNLHRKELLLHWVQPDLHQASFGCSSRDLSCQSDLLQIAAIDQTSRNFIWSQTQRVLHFWFFIRGKKQWRGVSCIEFLAVVQQRHVHSTKSFGGTDVDVEIFMDEWDMIGRNRTYERIVDLIERFESGYFVDWMKSRRVSAGSLDQGQIKHWHTSKNRIWRVERSDLWCAPFDWLWRSRAVHDWVPVHSAAMFHWHPGERYSAVGTVI